VAEDRIKSAREIAMEKVAKLPNLTPEEIREQKEREYIPRGEVIARKYLAKALRETDLKLELDKYQGEEAQIVRQAFLSTLGQSIGLEEADQGQRALEGMRALGMDVDYERAKEEFTEISRAFNHAQEKAFERLEEAQKEMLRRSGISGSAVRPDVTGNKDVQNELQQMRQPYESRLHELKERLLGHVT